MDNIHLVWLHANTTKQKLVRALRARNLGLMTFVETTNNSKKGFKIIDKSTPGNKNDVVVEAVSTDSDAYYKALKNIVTAPEYLISDKVSVRSTKANYIVSLDDLLDTYMAGLLIGHKEALNELRIKYAEKLGYKL